MNDAAPNQPEPEEQQLVQALRAGEEQAYEMLVRAHGGRLLAVARRFLRNEEDARDAVQEAFLQAFKAVDRFQGDARLSTWLHRIVVNAALMRRRKATRKSEPVIEDLLPNFLEDGHRVDPGTAWRASASDSLERAEIRELVRSSIDRLPEDFRDVLLLRDIEEWDTQETARQLGIKPGAVKTRLHRARQALRTLLDPHLKGSE